MNEKENLKQNSNETSKRKSDHLDLVIKSQIDSSLRDDRFYYEPLLSSHPNSYSNSLPKSHSQINFLGKNLRAPLWISSMTGGTQEAFFINQNLARAAAEFGLGMGLGSCRILLDRDKNARAQHGKDFQWRKVLGPDLPFFANLGIAQLEECVREGKEGLNKIVELINFLEADGLIIHINPLQEWLQPEGDHLKNSPLETLNKFFEIKSEINFKINSEINSQIKNDFKIIVKEVGQGMGPASLRALLQLPLAAVEFAAFGGTNFSLVEMQRNNKNKNKCEDYFPLARIGHTCEEMIEYIIKIQSELGEKILVKEFIISGGVKSFLDGHYLMNKLGCPSIYGHGKAFLEKARISYDELKIFIQHQLQGLSFAQQFLKIK